MPKKMMKVLCLVLILSMLPLSAALAELRRGDESPEVTDLQRMLFECGWLFELPDGNFGRNTEKAVRDYEAYAGLPVDGIADDAMVGRLTADWTQMMQERGELTDEGDDGYTDDDTRPPFCTHLNMQDGNAETDYCETHLNLHFRTYKLMSTGDIEDAKEACALWEAEIIRLYDLWYTLADESEKDAILAARALYLSSVEAHRIAIDGWYSCFQEKVSTEYVEYTMELPLREHAAWLCDMLSGSLTRSE